MLLRGDEMLGELRSLIAGEGGSGRLLLVDSDSVSGSNCNEPELLRLGESKRRVVPRKLFDVDESNEGQSTPKSIAEWKDSDMDDSGL